MNLMCIFSWAKFKCEFSLHCREECEFPIFINSLESAANKIDIQNLHPLKRNELAISTRRTTQWANLCK